MNLVFVNYPLETFTPTQSGALATIIYELARCAQNDGLKPLVITQSSPAKAFEGIDSRFLHYPAVPEQGLRRFVARARRKLDGCRHFHHRSYARKVAHAIRDAGAQDLPIFLFNDPEMTIFLRRQFPKANLVHWFQNQHDCKPRYQKAFGKAATTVAAVSSFTAQWVEQFYALPKNSVQILPNGVDTTHFTPAPSSPDGPLVISFVGRTGIEKGPDVFLKAALKLSARTTNFRVQLLGSNHWDRFELDDYQKQLQSYAQSLQQKGVEVRCPGHIGRMALPGELRRAHIHVIPARWDEPFGMTTIEGMACGLATVASRTGGTPEVTGDAALLFERESVDALAAHLETLMADAPLRQDYAMRARHRAEEFDWARSWARVRLAAGV